MKKLIPKIIILVIMISAIFLTLPFNNIAMAQEAGSGSKYEPYATGWDIIPYECIDPKGADKPCDVNSFIQLFVNLSNIMLKLITPLAMIIIIFAGYQFITARGKQEQIQSGKKILGGVFIGMVIIVFGGWVISYFIVQTLVGGFGKDKSTKLFQSNEYKPWTQEWWRPNENKKNNQQFGPKGVCFVTEVGCKDTNETECKTIINNFPAQQGAWTKDLTCDSLKQQSWTNFRDNYLIGTSCCTVGTGPFYDSCNLMNSNYCLDFPGSEANTNICGILGGCAL